MLRTTSSNKRYRAPSTEYINNLALEMDNLIPTKEFIKEELFEFVENDIFYKVKLLVLSGDPLLHEYRVNRSNILLDFKGCAKQRITKLIESNNCDPIWYEDYFYYLPNTNLSYSKTKDFQIDYIEKRTFFLESEPINVLK